MNSKRVEQVINTLKEFVLDWGKADVFLVGGCVRDMMMKMPIEDIDICINLPNGPELFCKYLKEKHGDICSDFILYPKYKTAKFVLKKHSAIAIGPIETTIECSMPRKETYKTGPRKPDSVMFASLAEDAMRRDFCMNAIYKNIVTGEIIDPSGCGLKDIKNEVISSVIDPEKSFKEDPLRMIRAIRFSYVLGFEIEQKTNDAITDYPEYYKLSMERINEELQKILMPGPKITINEKSKNISEVFIKLHNKNLLKHMIPELEECWGFNQNNYHHVFDLTTHMLNTLDIVDEEYKTNKTLIAVKLAALLHDIGKYKCYQVKDNGEYSYHQHEKKSAEMTEKILKRLRFDKDTIEITKDLIEYHMILKPFYNYNTDSYEAKTKTTVKIIRKLEEIGEKNIYKTKHIDYIELLLDLINADNLTNNPKYNMPGQVKSFKKEIDNVLSFKKEILLGKQDIHKVNGNKAITELNIKFKPALGEILEILDEYMREEVNIDENKALEKFKEEFEGKELYVWKGDYTNELSTISLSCPDTGDTNVFKLKQKTKLVNYIEHNKDTIDPEITTKVKEHVYRVPAKYEPKLYRQLRIMVKARELIQSVTKNLEELTELDKFENIHLYIDRDRDLEVTVIWENFVDIIY